MLFIMNLLTNFHFFSCINIEGSFSCVCAEGLVGDPSGIGCKKPGECSTDSDCSSSAVCVESKCKNPCENPEACGRNAECISAGHEAICKCPQKTRIDSKGNCIPIECESNSDCSQTKSCIETKCVNPCTLSNACGPNSDCTPSNHVGICSCKAGTTGDPHLGCVDIQYCASDNQCASGSKCNNGVCTEICTSSRDCLPEQLCIKGICQPTCKSNTTCPDYQFCSNNICTQEVRCRESVDCSYNEKCFSNSLGRTDCVNACEGVLCGRNAECVSKNHKATCKCKSGYKGNPNDDKHGCRKVECDRNNQCSNDKLCDQYMCKIACLVNNPCGKNALCSAENHKQVCYCQPGYTGNGRAGCQLIDFCADQPCGPDALCHNSRGSFKCQCPHGSVGDPYNEGCRAPAECENNRDCPNAAKCDTSLGIAKCTDVCENALCGPNADCISIDHTAHCSCKNGYQGNPNDLTVGCRPKPITCKSTLECPANTYCYGSTCRPFCQADTECGLFEKCIQAQCLNPCELTNACGMNAKCFSDKHEKQCQCPSGFTGNPNQECFRLPTSCSSSGTCSQDYVCQENSCVPRCKTDNECAFNEKCVKSICKLTCRVDNDCFLGHICLNNICLYGCHVDDDCSGSESCRNNKCTNPCLENPCGPNALCTVSNHRASCSCGTNFVPNPSAKIGCVRTPAPSCRENKECASGNICIDKVCRTVCSSDEGCLNKERCDTLSKVCKPICRRDDDCRNGEICNGLVCTIGCRSDTGCESYEKCVNTKCTNPCDSPTSCGTNAECSVISHRKLCACPSPLVGNPLETCRNPTRNCKVDTECPERNVCYGNTCQKVCRT